MVFQVDSVNIEKYGVYNAVLLGYLFALAERKGRDKWFQVSTKQIYRDLGIGDIAAKKVMHFWHTKGVIERDGDAVRILENRNNGVVEKSNEGEIQCPHCNNRQSVADKQVCVWCKMLIWNFDKQKKSLKEAKNELAAVSE